MFCHKCGNKAIEEAVFCDKCGAKLINEEKEIVIEEAQKAYLNATLVNIGENKMLVIKTICDFTGISLKEAKEMSENLPKVIKENVSQSEANLINSVFSSSGATVIFTDNKNNSVDVEFDSIVNNNEKHTNIASNKKDSNSLYKVSSINNFTLFDRKIEIPMELVNYNVFHDKYTKLAINMRKEFERKYKRFHNIDQLLDGFFDLCDEIFENAVNIAANDLLSNNVLDANPIQVLESMKKINHGSMNVYYAYAAIEDKYIEISEDKEAQIKYREARKRNRGRWVGGGFGVQGAINGAIKAGAMNAVSGVAHGAVNMVGNTFTAIGSGIQKVSLFNDPKTYKSLESAFYKDCQNILLAMVDILKKNGMRIKAITDKEIQKAHLIMNNVDNPNFPENELLSVLIQIVLLNPYQEDVYRLMIANFGDRNNEVENLARYFHVDISKLKADTVRKYFDTLPFNTLEEALNSKQELEEVCIELGGIPNELSKRVDDIVNEKKYDKLFSVYKDTRKTTLDEWDSCRKSIESLCLELDVSDKGQKIFAEMDKDLYSFKCDLAKQFLSSNSVSTEEDAIETQNKLKAYCNEIELALNNPVIEEINTIVNKFDTDIRTVEGYEFESREKAAKALNEKKSIDDLLGGYGPVSIGDYRLILQYLDNNQITPELEQIYRNRCNEALDRIKRKSKRAVTYQYRQNTPLHLFGDSKCGIIIHAIVYAILILFGILTSGYGLIISLPIIIIWELIKRILEKKAWKELTCNGQNELLQVLADEPNQNSKQQEILQIQCDAESITDVQVETSKEMDIYNRLKVDSASCPKIKDVVLNEKMYCPTTTIKAKYFKYHCFWRNLQKNFGIAPTWFNMIVSFIVAVIDGIFATLFFEEEYYLPLTICLLIECILWFPFMIKGYREKKEITDYISKTLNCELRASKGGYIISGIMNTVIIILGIFALCFSIDDMSYDESYYQDYEEEDTYYNYETTSAEKDNNDIVSLIYNNEDEGFSFMYPDDWSVENDPEYIVYLYHEGSDVGEYAEMTIIKEYFNAYDKEWLFSASLTDFQEEYSYIDENAEVISLNNVTLSGYPARKLLIKYDTSDLSLTMIYYFYAVNSDVYCISFTSYESCFDKYKPIFDAIIESYNISTEKSSTDKELTSDIYDNLFKDELFFNTNLSEFGEYQSTLTLYPDGQFVLYVNLYEGMGNVYGNYLCENDDIISFYVSEKDFSGFIGDDVEEFYMQISDSKLVYYQSAVIGCISEGDEFYLVG